MTSFSIPSSARLRQLATGRVASIMFNVGTTNVLRIASSMTLTRLLDSTAYGVVGVITSVAFMLGMLSDVGIYDFLVRHHEGEERKFLDQVWTIRLIRGVMLALVMIAISKPITIFLGKPALAPVVAVWSLSFILDGFSSLAFATAVRHQKLWRLSNMELSANVLTLVVSITLAAITHSYWAMIGGMLAGSATKLVLSYALFPESRRRWHFDMTRSREMWSFSRYIAMSSILSLLIMQSDKVVLARIMPLSAYGLYAIAVTLAAAPAGLSGPYAIRVLLSVYSKAARENREGLRRIIYQTRRKVTLLYMAGVGGLLGGAPLLIEILYDPRYRGVTPFLQLLLISTGLRMPSLSAKQALIAVGRTGAQLIGNIASILWLAIGGAVGLLTGKIMLLVAIVGTVEVPNLICFLWSMRREGLINWREEALGPLAMATGAAAGAGLSWAAMAALGLS
ncbi:MAG: oligosaccharide flippase family protein [Sphingomonas sp.]|nr:oligosaccharide flippase family protein [Sphingomonas sp.]